MSETTTANPAAPVPAKKCSIESVMGNTLHSLLKAEPTNKQVRAQCLNLFKREIPPELVEYDKIKEWVEFNIEPKAVAAQPQRMGGIEIDATYSYTEYGTCTYRESRRGAGSISINDREMSEMVNRALERGDTLAELSERVEERARDNNNIETEGDGDILYDEYESSEEHDHDFQIDSDVEGLVREWLERNEPDALETLEGN